jgi:hypothetical protein
MRRPIFLAAFLAILQGCANEPAQPSSGGARPPELTPVDVAGDYTHEASHALVPAQWGKFRRVSLFRRGPEGQRLTVSYGGGNSQCPVAITIFLDPAEQSGSVDKAFASARLEVTQAFPTAVLDHEDARNDSALVGKRAFFVIDDRRMEVGVVQNKAWDVKHRVMYPTECEDVVRDDVNGFFPGWAH